MKIIFFFFFFSFSVYSFGQRDVDFTGNTILSSYIPLGIPVDTLRFAKEIEYLKTQQDTFRAISSLVVSFDDPHMIFIQHNINRSADSAAILNRKTLSQIDSSIKQHLSNRTTGYWINDRSDCIVAIVPSRNDSHILEGYAVDCPNKFYNGTRLLSSHTTRTGDSLIQFIDWESNYRQFARLKFRSAGEFQIGNYSRWRKIDKPLPKKLVPADSRASVSILDSSTVLFKIPSHSSDNIRIVDSLVKQYDPILRKSRLLILDIRNNSGGTPRVHRNLLPYIYTDSIIKGQGYTFVSRQLISYEKRVIKSIDSAKDPEAYKKQLNDIDSLELQVGQLKFARGKTIVRDSVYEYPKQVALLTNYACMSAAEIMVIDMRQSRKVTTFGESTAGATDNLDFFPILSPSWKYILYIPSFRIKATKEYNHYAKTGIIPDIPIPPGEQDWIKFVTRYFEKK
jgi:hypothetical protein